MWRVRRCSAWPGEHTHTHQLCFQVSTSKEADEQAPTKSGKQAHRPDGGHNEGKYYTSSMWRCILADRAQNNAPPTVGDAISRARRAAPPEVHHRGVKGVHEGHCGRRCAAELAPLAACPKPHAGYIAHSSRSASLFAYNAHSSKVATCAARLGTTNARSKPSCALSWVAMRTNPNRSLTNRKATQV